MGTALKLGVLVIVAISLALYARGKVAQPDEPIRTARVESLAHASEPREVRVEGTIVFEQAAASGAEPYVLYGEQKENGGTAIKTKRLVLPATYPCMAGDMPCSFGNGSEYPFLSGDHVRIEGIVDADVIYVRNVTVRS